jgi:hypothetical protein
MKCSKLRITFRPLVETLESRLQPGSLLTGQGYGWSLLADSFLSLDQSGLDSQVLVSQSSFSGSQTADSSASLPLSIPMDAHSENLAIAVASVAAARSSSLPANGPLESLSNTLVNNLAANLTNDNLGSLSSASPSRPIVLPAAAAAPNLLPSPATPMASVPQSPLGVAKPAQPASPAVPAGPSAPAGSGGSLHQGPHIPAVSLNTSGFHHVTLALSSDLVRAAPITLATTQPMLGGDAGNQATINFLSYLTGSAGTGPDSVNYVVANNEGGTNFLYVAGSVTDSAGRTDAFAAKLAGDGSSLIWITQIPPAATTPGPDAATGLAVNGTNVYVVGNFADPASTPQMDGFIVELDSSTGSLINQAGLNGSSFAAVTTDSSGNVYVAGSAADTNNAGQVDIFLMQVSGDLSTQNTSYGGVLPLTINNNATNSFVNMGGGLVLDSQGNAYFAGTVGVVGDPNNETFATFGRLSADGTTVPWSFYYTNVTPGPGGVGTAVAIDPSSGNIVLTGSFNDNGSSTNSGDPQGNPTPLNQDLLLDRVLPATGNPALGPNSGNSWFVDDRSGNLNRVGDWTGNDLVILSDGSATVTGAAFDPAAGTNQGDPASVPTKGIDVQVTHFNATDDGTTQNMDGDPENVFGGSGTDIGNGLALDPTTTTSPYNVYVVGSTTSTDLPTSGNVVGQTYSGTKATGFVGQLSVA